MPPKLDIFDTNDFYWNNNHLEHVAEFMRVYGQEIRLYPTIDVPEYSLRKDLILEEFNEFMQAWYDKDIVEIADALGDLIVVIYGTFLAFGLPANEIMNEIRRSNLSKLDENGTVIRSDTGKVLKGPNYSPPNISSIIMRAQKGI